MKIRNIIITAILLLVVPSVMALDFDVDCPSSVKSGTAFDCNITMPTAPSSGLTGLSFTLSTSTGVTVNSVTIDGGTDVSSGTKYGFFAISPLKTAGTLLATISLTATSSGTLTVTGIKGTDGNYNEISTLNFETGTITLAAAAATYSCTGTTPSNAQLCSGDSSGLTADTAKTLVSSCTSATKCEYTCASGYQLNSAGTACTAVTYSCTGTAPSNAQLCSGDSSSLSADTAITLVSSCTSATKCEYTCASGYQLNSAGTACEQETAAAQAEQTLGQQIDKALNDSGIDPTQKQTKSKWTLSLVSKIASLFKSWFGG